ncbi:MAG TPA: YcxB family protein [Streptosporangiaceae bacterium]|nr:YcxB family protein [Streptosporangiaceae bacterium]
MADKSAVSLFTLRCELDRDDVRDVMAASRLLTILRRSWMVACAVLVALLAELVVLLRLVISRPPGHTAFHGPVRLELVVGVACCVLLVCWSVLRVWRLSPGPQASDALARRVWQRGAHQYELSADGVTWRAPDRSLTFVPWSVFSGIRETERLFLLLDQRGRHVRGFIPKRGVGEPARVAELGRFVRGRIRAASSPPPGAATAEA